MNNEENIQGVGVITILALIKLHKSFLTTIDVVYMRKKSFLFNLFLEGVSLHTGRGGENENEEEDKE